MGTKKWAQEILFHSVSRLVSAQTWTTLDSYIHRLLISNYNSQFKFFF